MGIYVLEPEALRYIPPRGRWDFPDLVQALLQNGERVGAYRYNGLWFDIGRREDYEQAVAAWVEATGQGSAPAPAATAPALEIAAGRS
jgi:NDP-sugar pyrophosphorylase family protein